jgi:hypothetical protein
MLKALEPGTVLCPPRMVATTLATQALMPGTKGQVYMESVPLLSSQDGSGRVQAEG